MEFINWTITPKCNYNCSFCHRHNNELEDVSEDFVNKIINFINDISSKNYFRLFLTGGEPMGFPYFFDIINKVQSNNISLETNLSCDIKLLKDLCKINKNFFIKPTFHAQYADVNFFYKNLQILYDKKWLSQLNLTFEETSFDYIHKNYINMIKKVSKKMPEILINCMSNKNMLLSQDVLNILGIDKLDDKCYYRSSKYNLKYRKNSFNFKNILVQCYQKNMSINYNGDVFPCSSYISFVQKIEPLYNIIKQNKNSLIFHKTFINMKMKCESDWCCNGKFI